MVMETVTRVAVGLTAREARRAPSDAGLFDARQRGDTNPSPVNPNFDRLRKSAADEKPARNKCATSRRKTKTRRCPSRARPSPNETEGAPSNRDLRGTTQNRRRENRNGKRKSNAVRSASRMSSVTSEEGARTLPSARRGKRRRNARRGSRNYPEGAPREAGASVVASMARSCVRIMACMSGLLSRGDAPSHAFARRTSSRAR
jgi:hypothetical protein